MERWVEEGGEGELSRKEDGIKWMEFCLRKASPLPGSTHARIPQDYLSLFLSLCFSLYAKEGSLWKMSW